MANRYSGTFIINRFDKINTEYTKTVDQVPFFLNTVGPPSLRKLGEGNAADFVLPYYSSLSAYTGSTGPFKV